MLLNVGVGEWVESVCVCVLYTGVRVGAAKGSAASMRAVRVVVHTGVRVGAAKGSAASMRAVRVVVHTGVRVRSQARSHTCMTFD